MSKLDKLKSLIPLDELEPDALTQLYHLLDLDDLVEMALMPDAHPGYFVPIGGVILMDGIISPLAIGYDQGCGMCSIITDIHWSFNDDECTDIILSDGIQVIRKTLRPSHLIEFNKRYGGYLQHRIMEL